MGEDTGVEGTLRSGISDLGSGICDCRFWSGLLKLNFTLKDRPRKSMYVAAADCFNKKIYYRIIQKKSLRFAGAGYHVKNCIDNRNNTDYAVKNLH
jgi:hypothetical protein